MHIVCLEILKFVEKADRIVLIINSNKNIELSSFETVFVYVFKSVLCKRQYVCKSQGGVVEFLCTKPLYICTFFKNYFKTLS